MYSLRCFEKLPRNSCLFYFPTRLTDGHALHLPSDSWWKYLDICPKKWRIYSWNVFLFYRHPYCVDNFRVSAKLSVDILWIGFVLLEGLFFGCTSYMVAANVYKFDHTIFPQLITWAQRRILSFNFSSWSNRVLIALDWQLARVPERSATLKRLPTLWMVSANSTSKDWSSWIQVLKFYPVAVKIEFISANP